MMAEKLDITRIDKFLFILGMHRGIDANEEPTIFCTYGQHYANDSIDIGSDFVKNIDLTESAGWLNFLERIANEYRPKSSIDLLATVMGLPSLSKLDLPLDKVTLFLSILGMKLEIEQDGLPVLLHSMWLNDSNKFRPYETQVLLRINPLVEKDWQRFLEVIADVIKSSAIIDALADELGLPRLAEEYYLYDR